MGTFQPIEFDELQLLERQISNELDVTHKWVQDKNGRKTELFKLSVGLFTAVVAAFAAASKFGGTSVPDTQIALAVFIAALGYATLNIAIAKLYIDDHAAIDLAMAQVNLLRQASDCILYTLINREWPPTTPGLLKERQGHYWSFFGKRRAAPIDNAFLLRKKFWMTGDAFALATMLALAAGALVVPYYWFRDVVHDHFRACFVMWTIRTMILAVVVVSWLTLSKMRQNLAAILQMEQEASTPSPVVIALVKQARGSRDQ